MCLLLITLFTVKFYTHIDIFEIIIIIITAIAMVIIFYIRNQYNYLITYYYFKYYLSVEHLLLPY